FPLKSTDLILKFLLRQNSHGEWQGNKPGALTSFIFQGQWDFNPQVRATHTVHYLGSHMGTHHCTICLKPKPSHVSSLTHMSSPRFLCREDTALAIILSTLSSESLKERVLSWHKLA
uniref:Uncharacterized protein n=1 Tax=Chrysemys picta bellii TaxID=8478 RepID=A0A8C3I3R6_CHRPI